MGRRVGSRKRGQVMGALKKGKVEMMEERMEEIPSKSLWVHYLSMNNLQMLKYSGKQQLQHHEARDSQRLVTVCRFPSSTWTPGVSLQVPWEWLAFLSLSL